MKAYVASGWFTDEQEEARLKILEALDYTRFDYYSPKDHGIYVPGKTPPQDVFNTNIFEINLSNLVVASTIGKDMGTIFECGCAYTLKKPIVYLWESNDPLNLMLSESSVFIATSTMSLIAYLTGVQTLGLSFLKDKQVWKGKIE